ncbi:MAG TPA: hypothetical protein VGJ91_01645, partial [Polyangiaceae bacterium]
MRIEAGESRVLPTPSLAATARGAFPALVQKPRLSAPEARTLLGNAWSMVVGHWPEPRTSALLTAHWA